MKRIVALIAAVLAALTGFAQEGGSPQERYIAKYRDIAVEEMFRSGVPASITLAQGILESGSGQSTLAVEGNNHFGIKCGPMWEGKTMKADDDRPGECFRVYDTPEDSFRDHSDFLRYQDRYKFLFDLYITDYKGWALGLKSAGYATDPEYPSKLISIIERYQLYDLDFIGSEEEEPASIEQPEQPQTGQPQGAGHEEPYRPAAPDEQNLYSLSRELYTPEGVPFVVSYEGETYKSIAKQYNLFTFEILRFNGVKSNQELKAGTRVYLQPRKKAKK